MRTVILVRCTIADDRVVEQVASLREALPEVPVYAVPDLISGENMHRLERFEEAGIETLPLTREYLDAAGLSEAESKTGWVCGDYVFCRALDLPWDYAWIVEPDLFFLNGAEKMLSDLAVLEHDLAATFIRPGIPQWHWYKPLDDLNLGKDIHAMAFPFVRVSRTLAEKVLDTRREISRRLPTGAQMPNDESVVATEAHAGNFAVVDLARLFPDVFQYWSSVTRHNVEDIAARETERRIVHSGHHTEPFEKYLHAQLEQVMKGSEVSKTRILRCLESASRDTVDRFLQHVLDVAGEHTD